MQTKLKIPDRIKVGFQKRTDTYTGKLAYIISLGKNGKKTKEDPKSWVGWRDKSIDPEEYDNVPTEGFVLNRDVGGTQRGYDWNARREKVRVFDPRDFEFEITVENVLLILQECSSIKGKGLEGEFIYSWSGSQLVLLPVTSQEYKNAAEFIDLGNQKIAKSDVVEGCTYLTKDKVNVMYLGRHPWFENASRWGYSRTKYIGGKKMHIFLNMDHKVSQWEKDSLDKNGVKRLYYMVESGFTMLAKRTSDSPVPQFADEYVKLTKSCFVSVLVELVIKPSTKIKTLPNYLYSQSVCVVEDGKIYKAYLRENFDWNRSRYYGSNSQERRFDITGDKMLSIKDGGIIESGCKGWIEKREMKIEDVREIINDLHVKCENGSEYSLI